MPATFADRVTGLNMVHAIMAALLARVRTRRGQSVEVPMFECLLQFVLGEHLSGATWEPPIGPMGHSRMLAPNRKPYATKDGHVCALMYNDAHWKAFFALVGEPQRFEADARFTTQSARITHSNAILWRGAGTPCAPAAPEHWLSVLAANDIPVMHAVKLDELLTGPHLAATGHGWMWRTPRGPPAPAAPTRAHGGHADGGFQACAAAGRHTQEVLASLHPTT